MTKFAIPIKRVSAVPQLPEKSSPKVLFFTLRKRMTK